MKTVVSPMLAASEIPLAEDIPMPCMASLKYDGMRCLAIRGVAMSRKMLPFENKFVQAFFAKYADWLDGLDGEIIVGPPNLQTTFNTTTSGITREEGSPDFMFYVVDAWSSPVTASGRYLEMQEGISLFPPELEKRVHLVTQATVRTIDHLKKLYDIALDSGYEGLILKHPAKAYKNGRSTLNEGILLKWKNFEDCNCVVLAVKQGKSNLNLKTRDELGKAKRSTHAAGKVFNEIVGGFLVRCIEPESVFFGKEFSCGPGSLKKDELRDMWLIRDQIPGRIVKVKHQTSGAKDAPRFPMWNGWRAEVDTGSTA